MYVEASVIVLPSESVVVYLLIDPVCVLVVVCAEPSSSVLMIMIGMKAVTSSLVEVSVIAEGSPDVVVVCSTELSAVVVTAAVELRGDSPIVLVFVVSSVVLLS